MQIRPIPPTRLRPGLYRPDQFGAEDNPGRHNALLVANSLIIGALAIGPTALLANKWAALALLAAGLVTSGAWFVITVQGRSVMKRHEDPAGAFASSLVEERQL
jgi:hypothetical protein